MAKVPAPDSADTPQWARTLVRLLDDAVTIPGTRIGVGLDAILGFIFPTLGDAATGLGSIAILFLALQLRVPKVVILRIVLNIAIDVLVGSIPFLGDAFDLYWRSNRRNLELVQGYQRDPSRKPGLGDYLIVALGVLLVIAAVVLPLVLGVALLRWLFHQVSS